jgi:hypothetical protein
VHLPDDATDIVSTYLRMIYTSSPLQTAQFVIGYDVFLARLYLFTDRIRDTKAKEDTINAFIEYSRSYAPGAYCVHVVYNESPENSPLRQFLAHYFAFYAQPTWFVIEATSLARYPRKFVEDTAMIMFSYGKPVLGPCVDRASFLDMEAVK